MTRFIICLQYHESDKPQAERLLRLIADCEREPRDDVELLLCRRFDAAPMTEAMIYAAGKFKVSGYQTHTRWTGWPAGPNAMVKDVLTEAASRVKSGEWADVDGLLMIEPDCVPMSPNWIDVIRGAWRVTRGEGRWMMGSWRNSGGEFGHINGNAVVMPDLAERISLDCIGSDLAWDCAIVPQIKNYWQVSNAFKNCFESRGATEYDLKTPETGVGCPALVHGYKDTSAIEIAERWLR